MRSEEEKLRDFAGDQKISWRPVGTSDSDVDGVFYSHPTWKVVGDNFPRLLSAWTLYNGIQNVVPYQQLVEKSDDLWLSEEPNVVVFFSHTWEEPEHPDPTGRQGSAMKQFLQQVYAAFKAYENPNDRLKWIPDLLREGVPQAAGVVLCWRQGQRRLHEMEATTDMTMKDFLSRIGVFYDFMCLPQNIPSAGIMRTLKQDSEMRTALSYMEVLCKFSAVISLRFEEDAYDSRAWCSIESAAGGLLFYDLFNNTSDITGSQSFSAGYSLPLYAQRLGQRLQFMDAPNQVPVVLGITEETAQKIRDEIEKLKSKMESLNHHWLSSFDILEFFAKYIFGAKLEKGNVLLNTAQVLLQLSLKSRELQNLTMMERMASLRTKLLQNMEQIHSGGVQSILPPDGVSLSCFAVLQLIYAFLFQTWVAVQDHQGPLLFNVGRSVTSLVHLAGLSCTSGADLTYVGLTAAASNPNQMFSSFFRVCRRAWLDLPKPKEDLFVKLHAVVPGDGWDEEDRERLERLRIDHTAFESFYRENLGKPASLNSTTDASRSSRFLERFHAVLRFEIPHLAA